MYRQNVPTDQAELKSGGGSCPPTGYATDPKRLNNGVNGPVLQVHETIRILQSSANVNATSNSSIAQLHSSPVAEFNAIC